MNEKKTGKTTNEKASDMSRIERMETKRMRKDEQE